MIPTQRLAYALLGTALSFGSLTGCELFNTVDDEPGAAPGFSYSRDVQSLFDSKCVGCHGAALAEGGLRLDGWQNVVQGADMASVVVPFHADNSLLLRMVTHLKPAAHPADQGTDSLSAAEVDVLREWINLGARNDNQEVPFASADELLYVCNQDDATVSIIDTERNVVVGMIDLTALGFSEAAKPHHAAVEPDGSFWYVSLIGENVVLKFDRENQLVGQVTFATPGLLALHPTEDLLFVGRSLSAVNPPSSIGRIQRSSMEIEEIEVLFPRPHAMSIGDRGTHVYTASLNENQIMAVAVGNNGVTFTPVGGALRSFVQHATTPLRRTMFSSASLTNQLLVFDTTEPASPELVETLIVPTAPWHPVYTRDGEFVYVGNKDANTVTVVFVNPLIVREIISGRGLSEPHGSAVSFDGKYAYFSNRNTKGAYMPRYDFGDNALDGTVVVIDISTNTIAKVLEVGRFAAGIATR